MLLNLVSAANASNKDVLWGFIRREAPDASPETDPLLDHLVGYALKYYADFVKPQKKYRAPDDKERAALEDLASRLESWDGPLDGESLQTMVFAVGTERQFEPLRAWFTAIYEVCLGQSPGAALRRLRRALWREGVGAADPGFAGAGLIRVSETPARRTARPAATRCRPWGRSAEGALQRRRCRVSPVRRQAGS